MHRYHRTTLVTGGGLRIGFERNSSLTSAATEFCPSEERSEEQQQEAGRDVVAAYADKRRNYWNTVLIRGGDRETSGCLPALVAASNPLLTDAILRANRPLFPGTQAMKPGPEVVPRAGEEGTGAKAITVKSFSCRDCKRRFTSRDEVRAHAEGCDKKSGERQFVCEHCSASFRKSSNLAKHIALVEKKLRPFTCSICASAFGQKSNLTSHIRITRTYVPASCAGGLTKSWLAALLDCIFVCNGVS
jgi:uncharacterized C2H2 Zn-finger protein